MLIKYLKYTFSILIPLISITSFACVGEGGRISVYPGAPRCCEGLTQKMSSDEAPGSGGICVKEKKCLGEGETVVVYRGAPRCCEGLELQQTSTVKEGEAGICVLNKYPPGKNINDSQIQKKEFIPGTIISPSSNSGSSKQ